MTDFVSLPPRAPARFVWFLPAWFLVACLLGSIHPGHGGQLFFLGALAGVWACALLPGGGESTLGLLPTLLGGMPVLLLLGWLLDRLGGALWLWLVSAVAGAAVAGYLLLQGFPDFEAAIVHHGSIYAYGVCGLQLGGYFATLFVFLVQAGRGGRQQWE